MNKEELEGKKTCRLPYLSFSFSVIIFSISDWLLNGRNTSKKGWNKVLGHSWFLRTPLSSFCIQSKFWLMWKTSPLWAVNSLTYSTQAQMWHIFHMLWLCSCWAQTHCGITEFCVHGVPWALGWVGQPEMGADTHIVHFSSARGHVSLYNQLSIIKRKFKDKIMKNCKMATEEYYTNLGPFWGLSLVMPLHRPHGQGLGPGPARNTLFVFQ